MKFSALKFSDLEFIFIGICAGIFSGFFGIGGGVIIIILLTLLFGFSQKLAQGISIGALVIPLSLLPGLIEYVRSGNVSFRASILISLGLFIGSFFGAFIANKISDNILQRLFAVFLIFVAVRMLMK
jgi:uncharacterized membrane protein YfcA